MDGFGKDFIAGNTIGDTGELAGSYGSKGGGFGFLFAAIAGLAATFTACNCVVFAMIPGLACSTDGSGGRATAWKALGAFTAGVLVITGIYGMIIGFLGPDGVESLNSRPVRLAQAQVVFTVLGSIMLIWGVIEMDFLSRLKEKVPAAVNELFSHTLVKASLLGILVGLFAVGRPFPVFREFLAYAASSQNPVYGAGVMMVQGIGQIAVMVILFLLIVWLGRKKIDDIAARKPYKFRLISGLALIAGGTYFIYYWGLAFLLDIGRWGFKLGWY